MLADLKIILRDIGNILIALGIVMAFTLVIPLVFSEWDAIMGLLIPSSASIGIGLALRFSFRDAKEPELRHAMVTAALAWLIAAFMSALPFVFVAGMGMLDALFEGMSGWTSTGLTMIEAPDELSYTIQFWRSLMQWVGGVGVIVLMISILMHPGTGSYVLYKAEAREERIYPSVVSTVRTIWWIYLLFTAMGIILFSVAGMPIWEAINHSMTAIATGGFTVTEGSMSAYKSPMIEVVIIPMMILGAIPFLIHHKVLRGDFRALIRDSQCRILFLLIGVGALVLTAENYLSLGNINILDTARFSVFQFVSALTCTGFQTSDVHTWSPIALIVLSLAMVLGGAAGSTAGGVKLVRTIIAYKGIGWWFKRVSMPSRAITSFRLGDKLLSEEEANRVVAETTLITILWIVFLIAGILVLLYVVPSQYHLSDVIFEVASAQGNVGLSTGITSSEMNPIGKIVLIFSMWIGRLEIIPVMMLFRSIIMGMRSYRSIHRR
jgi:trk system potassium uptake protein TrkH